MAKGPQRSTETSILLRCDHDEKAFIEAGAELARQRLQKANPGAKLPVYSYGLAGAKRLAEQDLGITFEQWKTREAKKEGGRKT